MISFYARREPHMTAIKGTDFKKDFKNVCDRAYNGEVFIISRPHNENVVVISEKDYSQLEHLKAYEQIIRKMIDNQKEGTTHKRTIGKYADGLVYISDDFDDTLEGLEDYI